MKPAQIGVSRLPMALVLLVNSNGRVESFQNDENDGPDRHGLLFVWHDFFTNEKFARFRAAQTVTLDTFNRPIEIIQLSFFIANWRSNLFNQHLLY